jgi:hypothetical protein
MGREIVYVVVPKKVVDENKTIQYINDIIDHCTYPDEPITMAVDDFHDIYKQIKEGHFSSFSELAKKYGFKAPSIPNASGHSAHIVYSYFGENLPSSRKPKATQDGGLFNNLLNKFMGEEKNILSDQETPNWYTPKNASTAIIDKDIISIKNYLETHDTLPSIIIPSGENNNPFLLLDNQDQSHNEIDFKTILNQYIDDYLMAISWKF